MKRLWAITLSLILVISIIGCGEDEETMIEKPTAEEATQPTTPSLNVATVTIDATSKEKWTYFAFAAGKPIDIADPKTSMDWDIAFQKTTVKLNGGSSGPGQGGVVVLEKANFNQVTQAPESGYVSDSEASLAIPTESDKGWYHYTGPPNHWILPLEKVFVLKMADGKFAKLRFVGYYKDNENKKDSGFVTIEYVYQPNGSRNF